MSELLQRVIARDLPKLRQLSGFQRRSFEAILSATELSSQQTAEYGAVVTASTGAGKTYAFFLPVLIKMVLERCLRGKVGTKAICIYPRVALSENQLTDFIEALFFVNKELTSQGLPAITVGIESGATVYRANDFKFINATQEDRNKFAKMRGWVYSEDNGGYLAPFAYCVGIDDAPCSKQPQRLVVGPARPLTLSCPSCHTRYPFILFNREAMHLAPPDLLIATT